MANTSKTLTPKLQAKLAELRSELERHRGPVIAQNDYLVVIDCETCGFAHLRGGWAETPEYEHGLCQDLEWMRKERQEVTLGLWDAYFRATLEIIKLEGNHSLLDVGAGFGFFVGWAQERGHRVQGAEISKLALANSPLLKHPDEFATDRFWCLRYNLVLEHLADPEATLRQDIQRWQPERILITVPNEMNPAQKAVGGSWWVSRWHRNYFTGESLCRLLANVGFQPAFKTASYPMEWFILAGFDYRGRPEIGKKVHQIRLLRELHRGPDAYLVDYRKWHEEMGVGRELIYLFTRAARPERPRIVIEEETL
jgi:SAM-dependent methyltransferase